MVPTAFHTTYLCEEQTMNNAKMISPPPIPPARIRVIPVGTRTTYSFVALCTAMQKRTKVTIMRPDMTEVTGMVNGISPEDGSGKSWILRLCLPDNTYENVWVKAE